MIKTKNLIAIFLYSPSGTVTNPFATGSRLKSKRLATKCFLFLKVRFKLPPLNKKSNEKLPCHTRVVKLDCNLP